MQRGGATVAAAALCWIPGGRPKTKNYSRWGRFCDSERDKVNGRFDWRDYCAVSYSIVGNLAGLTVSCSVRWADVNLSLDGPRSVHGDTQNCGRTARDSTVTCAVPHDAGHGWCGAA
ncbi:hypothetical protein BCV70DRAFT_47720 [Testicularia cyperi]|uniref:Uncharacterized protein n=1 Tax=Testicularia cyperi TaxID=1882483 RepID=A0A317XIP4_9BASI|nr:hypothetical protein BCV70DRAFT_47720 [Testicularia cyperi]